RVTDDTDTSAIDHTGDSTTPTDGPAGTRLPAARLPGPGNRGVEPGPAPGRAPRPVRAHLHAEADRVHVRAALDPARDAHALNLGRVLDRHPRRPVPAGAIPTSARCWGLSATPSRSAAPAAPSRSRRLRSAGASARRRPRRSPPPGSPRAPGWWSSAADTGSKGAGRHRSGPQKPRLIHLSPGTGDALDLGCCPCCHWSGEHSGNGAGAPGGNGGTMLNEPDLWGQAPAGGAHWRDLAA